jgi:hypothetical protein
LHHPLQQLHTWNQSLPFWQEGRGIILSGDEQLNLGSSSWKQRNGKQYLMEIILAGELAKTIHSFLTHYFTGGFWMYTKSMLLVKLESSWTSSKLASVTLEAVYSSLLPGPSYLC